MPTKVRIFLAVLGLGLFIPTLIGIKSREDGDNTDKTTGVTALASPGCGELEYAGEGKPDVLVASDMTLGGPSRRASLQIVEAIRYELARHARDSTASRSSRATTQRPGRAIWRGAGTTDARSPTSRRWSA